VNNIYTYLPSQINYSVGYNNTSSTLNPVDPDVQEVLRLSERLARKNQQLQTTVCWQEKVIAEQAEKVRVYDRIASSEGGMSVRDAAKALKVKPSVLRNWLLDSEWMWQQASGYRVYQRILDQGLMMHRMRLKTYSTGSTGYIVAQVLITGKGLVRLGKEV